MGDQISKNEKISDLCIFLRHKGKDIQILFDTDANHNLIFEKLKRLQLLEGINKREQFIEQLINKEKLNKIADNVYFYWNYFNQKNSK